MSTTEKGNKLEDEFYQYLLDQKDRGELIYGVIPPELCRIDRKQKHYCKIRESEVEFDIVLELYAPQRSKPFLFFVFECKNHARRIQADKINEFSTNLGRIFPHATKGFIVTASPLQSGAANIAKNTKLGVIKYDENGFETILDRKGGSFVEHGFVRSQILENEHPVKSLKFSAYHDGKFFGSIAQLIGSFDQESADKNNVSQHESNVSIPFISRNDLQQSAQKVLKKIEYKEGAVDLEKICSDLSIDLKHSDQTILDISGKPILGSANFDSKTIQINFHENKQRERFTIAHEIGHFILKHDRYLKSDIIVEHDLFIDSTKKDSFNYERLEFQANEFASELLLPKLAFEAATRVSRIRLDIRERGDFGYIYVDDQPTNYTDYNQLLSLLSNYFNVSKQAIEIKFKKLGMLNDKRTKPESASFYDIVSNSNLFSEN